jgi:hypothetical protein
MLNYKCKFGCGGHLGRCSEMPDTILEEDHPRIISANLVEIGSVVSEEKIFFKFHLPFFLICIIGQNRQKFKVHKKSRNIC